ncbi:hypothetical protein GCM10020255_080760 [Rhodococcus baikonurensis]
MNERGIHQSSVDLAEFDAEPADLELMVAAAHVAKGQVPGPADQVTGAVHPRTGRRVRMRDKTIRRQCWTEVVTPCEARPTDVQLADAADRDRLQSSVEHHGVDSADGTADGDRLAR